MAGRLAEAGHRYKTKIETEKCIFLFFCRQGIAGRSWWWLRMMMIKAAPDESRRVNNGGLLMIEASGVTADG